MPHKLTTEQERVILHPIGEHARVLAVAGSGKSTTMAHRIKHLLEQGVPSSSISVLMFNALARAQFISHLDGIGLPEEDKPSVHTFHSFSFHLITQMVKVGFLPATTQFWLSDKSELVWLTVKRAITNLEKCKRIPPDMVDPEDALHAISLWKNALVPIERAGSHSSPYLPLVYQEFETLRLLETALTFDDFIPMTVDILEHNPAIHQRYAWGLRHLIVDEYQDINYGQQRLIELLAGSQADLMVVGDDDQCVYEWRGARPNYILHDFPLVFNNKPVRDYQLSRSFRFGPLISQTAANVIACNTSRVQKPLIAFQSGKPGFIHILANGFDSTKEITNQVLALMQGEGVPPSEIIVLARLYAQLENLEMEFLNRHIPYRIEGQEPFFKRSEIKSLLDYIRLARDYKLPLGEEGVKWLLNIANKPSRMLSRSLLSRLVSTAKYRQFSLERLFQMCLSDHSIGLASWQVDKVLSLAEFLDVLHNRLQDPSVQAGDLLNWMVETLDYLAYFQDYYGQGENSDEKKHSVLGFIRYASQLRVHPIALLEHLQRLDTTQGVDPEQQIVFTTIHKTKGLEYGYVVLPEFDEGLLPYLKGERCDIYDLAGIVQQSELSHAIESERRLAYVGITRARTGVIIGSSEKASRFLDEMHLKQTETVMGALQWLASGQPMGQHDLLEALKVSSSNPLLMDNLLNGYLPDLGLLSLVETIRKDLTFPQHMEVMNNIPIID